MSLRTPGVLTPGRGGSDMAVCALTPTSWDNARRNATKQIRIPIDITRVATHDYSSLRYMPERKQHLFLESEK